MDRRRTIKRLSSDAENVAFGFPRVGSGQLL
jgi:hypothetical protein